MLLSAVPCYRCTELQWRFQLQALILVRQQPHEAAQQLRWVTDALPLALQVRVAFPVVSAYVNCGHVQAPGAKPLCIEAAVRDPETVLLGSRLGSLQCQL